MKTQPGQDSNPSPDRSLKKHLIPGILWPVIFISQLIVAALASWQTLSKFDFVYPQAYELLDIGHHIETYGPKNRFRPDFATTNKAQHLLLFREIGIAIQNNGEGLNEITYTTSSEKSYKLLRKPEVIHLQDVADLVNVFYVVGYIAIVLLITGMTLAYYQHLTLPRLRNIVIGIATFVGLIGLVLLITGPRAAFYWLHIQIFPAEHEWFFYYQESLMTTLMKAPDLFGFIGTVMGVILLIFWILELLLLKQLLKK